MNGVNPLRGEAEVRIGRETFRIAVTFSALMKLSQATKAQTYNELYMRLIGFEPFAVACAIRCLIVADDDDKASALSAKILDDGNISFADQESWRTAIEHVFMTHIDAGHRHRDERTAQEMAETAALGERQSPS